MENEKIDADEEFIFCDDEVTQLANAHFGITYLFPWQRLVIANIIDAYKHLKNQDSTNPLVHPHTILDAYTDGADSFYKGRQIVLLPTGAGKSLCFQIPALLLDEPTLVIYPLLALMSDQERRMKSSGLNCVVFRGGMNEEQKKENYERIKNGAKIIRGRASVFARNNEADSLDDVFFT